MLLGRGSIVTMYVLQVSHKFKGIFVTFWEASVHLLCANTPLRLGRSRSGGHSFAVSLEICPALIEAEIVKNPPPWFSSRASKGISVPE